MVMAKGDTMPDNKAGQSVQGKPRCAVSPNTMKLVTLATLLVSDFDIVFTFVTMFAFFQAGGMYMAGIAIIGFFFLLYCAACVYAALESTKFVQRFQDKVKLNEINGITLEDLDDALAGKRIFWRGYIRLRPLPARVGSYVCANAPALRSQTRLRHGEEAHGRHRRSEGAHPRGGGPR